MADAGQDTGVLARALSDDEDRLVSADTLLSELQRNCGGTIPGTIAAPALLELVGKCRRYGMRLARSVTAQDGHNVIHAWVVVQPRNDGEAGCEIAAHHWRQQPLSPEDEAVDAHRRAETDQALAELTARLDARQNLLTVDADAADLGRLVTAMRAGVGRPWTDFVRFDDDGHQQPLHWRLLDGAVLRVEGSDRTWRASLFPRNEPGGEILGFELCLCAREALPAVQETPVPTDEAQAALIGRDIAPALRQPIARIIANAETIRSRMAGPLTEQYAEYAADIAAAGQHLLALLDDLADLEVVESENFSTASDRVDLAEVARQAAGILGVRARERGIVVTAPAPDASVPAIAEFRRVLQVLLNLLGNAIRYSPANSAIALILASDADHARITVADSGPGLSADQQARVFEKFERLGRSGDGGSGLGLYISRRMARAMGGELSVESVPGGGARFTLEVPAALDLAPQRLSSGT